MLGALALLKRLKEELRSLRIALIWGDHHGIEWYVLGIAASAPVMMMNCVNWVMSWLIELKEAIDAVSDVSRVKYDQSI